MFRSIAVKILSVVVVAMMTAQVLTGMIGYFGMSEMRESMETIYAHRVIPLQELKIVADAYAVEIVDTSHKLRAGSLDWAEAKSHVDHARAEIEKNWSAYLATDPKSGEREIAEKVGKLKLDADRAIEQLMGVIKAQDRDGLVRFVEHDLYPLVDPFSGGVGELVSYQLVAASEVTSSADQLFTRFARNALIYGSLILVLAFGFVMSVTRRISGSIGAAVELARAVAAGDLSAEGAPGGDDETGELMRCLNAMAGRLREVIGKVQNVSRSVAADSATMSTTANQLSMGASDQASATEQASAAMEQMAATIRQSAENADQTEKIARTSVGEAVASGKAVREALEAMSTIAAKISVVEEIARQTDLLALNAAVEAARAGAHGVGFSVVASEVRSLAERSRIAAAEISVLSVSTGNAAKVAGEKLDRLLPLIQTTSDLVARISAASREIDTGASQVNSAIRQLDAVTEQNTGAASDMSGSAKTLSRRAGDLRTAIGFFQLSAEQLKAAEPDDMRRDAA